MRLRRRCEERKLRSNPDFFRGPWIASLALAMTAMAFLAIPIRRHGRACPGHPRAFTSGRQDVDARDERGHDESWAAIATSILRADAEHHDRRVRPRQGHVGIQNIMTQRTLDPEIAGELIDQVALERIGLVGAA